MKWLIIISLFFYANSLSALDKTSATDYCICNLQSITIEGKTNVSHFFFMYQNAEDSGNIARNQQPVSTSDTGWVKYTIPVDLFKGSDPAMEKDFYTLLKASLYPTVTVSFGIKSILNIIEYKSNNQLFLHLTLAGVTKTVKVEYAQHTHTNNFIILNGITYFHLTDFGLDPPEKIFGLVRVQDIVSINFDIILSQSN